MALSRTSWKTFKRTAKAFKIDSLGGHEVLVRPISARRRGEIGDSFPVNEDGKIVEQDAYTAALVAEMVVDDAGEKLFEPAELLAEDFDDLTFRELSAAIVEFLGVKKEKNLTGD